MVALSYVTDKGPNWEITIFLSGPKPIPGDADRSETYRGRYIRYCYLISKAGSPGKPEMKHHAADILNFYEVLRDEHPLKFYDLYCYAYNHPPCDVKNAPWLYSNQYWGPGVPGRVDRLEVKAKHVIITMQVDFEDLMNNEWIMREDSSDELDFSSDGDPLNISIPSYHSTSSDDQGPFL